jgi:hypothetical protein
MVRLLVPAMLLGRKTVVWETVLRCVCSVMILTPGYFGSRDCESLYRLACVFFNAFEDSFYFGIGEVAGYSCGLAFHFHGF